MNNNIPTYIPLTDFATTNNISKEELTQQVIAGKLKAVQLPNGELLVQKDMPKTKDQIINNKFGSLKGQPITVTEAIKKYKLSRGTPLIWAKKGYVNVLKENGKGSRKELDESDIAYCAEIYHSRNGISGVPLLDKNGLAYKLKHPELSEYRKNKKH